MLRSLALCWADGVEQPPGSVAGLRGSVAWVVLGRCSHDYARDRPGNRGVGDIGMSGGVGGKSCSEVQVAG